MLSSELQFVLQTWLRINLHHYLLQNLIDCRISIIFFQRNKTHWTRRDWVYFSHVFYQYRFADVPIAEDLNMLGKPEEENEGFSKYGIITSILDVNRRTWVEMLAEIYPV